MNGQKKLFKTFCLRKMSDLNEFNLEDIKRTIRQGLNNLPGYYKYQQGQKQGGKYYSPGLTPLLPIEALGAGFKTPEEYKKKYGEYPSGYSKPEKTEPPKTEPPKTEPPKTQPPKAEPPKAEPPKTQPPKTQPPKNGPNGVDLDAIRQYGGYGYDNTLTNTDNIYRQMKKKYNKESYDVVLEYLLSEGHAETLEEANYVMMQMTSEHLRDIVEERTAADPGMKGRMGRSNPSINGKPIPNPPGHPDVGKPMSYTDSETRDANKYREASQKTGTKIRADEQLPKK